MVEMLAVVAIIVILLGVSMVSVARYRDLLKITELDNAAREIYMAAENRAVLLSGARRLSNQVNKAGQPVTLTGHGHSGGEMLYYVSKASMTEDLLTDGSIDPALVADGVDFYIVYDQNSGSVTDVFYAEESMSGLVGTGDTAFQEFYKEWAVSRSERLAKKDTMLVGWYNGEAAEGSDEKKDFPEEPWIRVIIENGEELTVTVEYEAPAPATLSVKLGSIALTNKRLVGVTLPEGEITVPAGKGSFTWVLDSLTNGKFVEIDGVKNISGEYGEIITYMIDPGDDFTVEATLTPQTPGDFENVSASDKNNSLFQKGSGDETAGIGYLRHLQNLDTAFSGVTDKTSAVQTENILCGGNETYGNYDFIPIYNAKLARYHGGYNPEDKEPYEIRNLYVSGERLSNHAGLFSRTASGTSAPTGGYTFQNIRLVNASVTAVKGCYAGALVGQSGEATLLNCWVYWETDETVPDLKAELVENAEENQYIYQVNGKYAGGLVGEARGNFKIDHCLAATLVKGKEHAGGLIGYYGGDKSTTITYSYADCYLTGEGNVAGLIGNLDSGRTANLINCYAAGFIMGGKNAAGLCLGDGKTNATNVYTVVRHIGNGDFSPLTGHPTTDDQFTHTYFLESKDWTGTESSLTGVEKLSFTEMSDSTSGKMNAIAGNDNGLNFQWKTGADGQSHPYNLRTDLGIELTVYDYPGLKGMPHYGDWTTDFKGTSLVYYEKYQDGSYGVTGGNINTLKNNQTVVSDGYAVVCRADDLLKGQTEVSIEYTWSEDGVMTDTTGKSTYTKGSPGFTDSTDGKDYIKWTSPDGEDIHLYLFLEPNKSEPEGFHPDVLSNSEVGESSFYRYLNASVTAGSGTNRVEMSTRAFYNPHFAETVVPITANYGSITNDNVEELAGTLVKSLTEIKVRTPRHLYDLSQFKEYYNQKSYKYLQMLDLDYSTYNEIGDLSEEQDPEKRTIKYDKTEDKKDETGKVVEEGHLYAMQQPIGSGKTDDAFEGTYDGGCHMIKGVVPDAKDTVERQYAGLFGYSKGTLRNIVYQLDAENRVDVYLGDSAQDLYVGTLAGGSERLIENCAVFGVNLRAGASGVRLYVGGLVGWNGGTIRNSAAELAQLSADCLNYASVYAGGLVGENGASCDIYTSYAVGRISAIVDKTIETARICGFVGWNYGSIANSYAAVDLSSGGDNVEAYGFCGMRAGSQSGNVYLDQGNFTYRGSSYAAEYERTGDKATSTVYGNLTKPNAVSGMGPGGKVWGKPADTYPYPAAVRDRNGAYIHYGDYPVPMPLGEMGVFYWEKLVSTENGKATYHMSALAVDPKEGAKTITKQSTLRTDHDDGCVITDYGYGYYAQNENNASVSLTPDKIAYIKYQEYNNRKTWLNPKHKDFDNYKNGSGNSWPENKEANEALDGLMNGYTFHCWDTYREAPRTPDQTDYRDTRSVSGLCLYKDGESNILDPSSGTFTLTQTGSQTVTVKFIVNPQFADAMSVNNPGNLTVTKGASTVPPGTKVVKDGTEEINYFQIRCGLQLQDINWYDTAYTDVPMSFGNSGDKDLNTVARFPYLSGIKADGKQLDRDYYWIQTHDIDWTAEGKAYPLKKNDGTTEPIDGVFFPIAQTRIMKDNQSLPGWFGGSYDGQNYTIKNLKIGLNIYNYQVNTMGLFGAVKGARLKNIVMFSESGQDVVTVKGRSNNNDYPQGTLKKDYDGLNNLLADNYAWYAGGVLVGLAVKDDQGKGEITNCSVAGYTVRDETIRAQMVQAGNGSQYYTMGGAIGGLVGMTNMDMTGCTAAATIEIVCDHSKGGDAAPIRVGGLVGSTTAKVENCYTGGEIVTSIQDEKGNIVKQASKAAIYAGRLVGGVGMGPFDNSETSTKTVTVSNCYSYLTLPDTGKVVVAAYNIGGGGRTDGAPAGTVTTTRDYYYGANAGDGGTSVTYRQLAGEDVITGTRKIYDLLTGYSRVTSTLGGVAVGGRYSYAPKSRPELQGLDYPFPTILTQPGNLHVHYGGWPLRGIMRDKGGAHIRLDMFADRSEPETKQNGDKITTWREHAETLKLSDGVVKDGTWSAAVAGDGAGIAEAKFDDPTRGELTVTAKKPRLSPVTVTVTYKEPGANGAEYSMNLTVFVTAKVELRPNAVTIFPNDTITVPLSAYGVEPGETDYKPITGGTLTVNPGVTGLSDPITSAEVVTPPEGEPDVPPSIKLIRGDGEAGEEGQWADVTYTCTKDGYPSEKTVQRIAVNLPPLPESWSEDGTVWTLDFSGYKPTALSANLAVDVPDPGFTLEVEKNDKDELTGIVTLTKGESAQFPEDGVKLTVTLTVPDDFVANGITHELAIAVLPKPEEGG